MTSTFTSYLGGYTQGQTDEFKRLEFMRFECETLYGYIEQVLEINIHRHTWTIIYKNKLLHNF